MNPLSKAFLTNAPLLIQPSIAKAYVDRVASLNIPMGTKASEMTQMLEALFGPRPAMHIENDTAVIPLKGVISKGITELEAYCGAIDVNEVEAMLKAALADPNVNSILIDVDSPGGTCTGVPELANMVRMAGKIKHTRAFTDSEACSAAYWIASQCNEFFATPSSTIGSIGVYTAVADMTEAYAKEGVKMELFKAGKYKATGFPGVPMSKEQKEHVQSDVIEIWNDFKGDVKSVRMFAEESAMEGQTFSGKAAAKVGLVTHIVNDYSAVALTKSNSQSHSKIIRAFFAEEKMEKTEEEQPGTEVPEIEEKDENKIHEAIEAAQAESDADVKPIQTDKKL